MRNGWIFLGFDDKIGRKPLRFKCDAHSETCTDAVASATCFDAVADSAAGDPCCLRYGARIGVFGCTPAGLETGMEDCERDYAERTSEEIVNLTQRFCTPRGEALDVQWFGRVLAKVAGVVVDGALLKTAQYMKAGRFPNIVIIMRDPAHVIRSSCRDPLHDAEVFSEQNDRLFGQRHAVLKDFMNSGMWQDQLQKCQKVLQISGDSTPGLTSVLRHLDFVQPRFESFVAPRRRYVCLLRAIAMVLATKAGDQRLDNKVRHRANEALKAMSKMDDCFAAGLAGDYGEVCLEFLRKFDVTDHDPARTAQQVREFTSSLQDLFVKGYVLTETSESEEHQLGARKTLAQIALENMRQPLLMTCPLASGSPIASLLPRSPRSLPPSLAPFLPSSLAFCVSFCFLSCVLYFFLPSFLPSVLSCSLSLSLSLSSGRLACVQRRPGLFPRDRQWAGARSSRLQARDPRSRRRGCR